MIRKSNSYKDLMKNIKIDYNETNRGIISKLIRRNNISVEHFTRKKVHHMNFYEINKESLSKIIENSFNIKQVIDGMKIHYCNNNVNKIKEKIKEYKIDISHFKNQRKGNGK